MSLFPVFGFVNPAVLTYGSVNTSATDGGGIQLSFPSMSLGGAASADRYVFASIAVSGATGIATAAGSIGGISATLRAYVDDGSGDGIMIFNAKVPTGTTGTVVVQLTDIGSAARAHCFTYSAVNLQGGAATASTSDTSESADALDGTITVPDGGFVLGHAMNMATGSRTWTWTNLTESAETGSYSSGRSGSIAYSTTAGEALRTATADGGISNDALLLTAWR